jgi:hypothetical protein
MSQGSGIMESINKNLQDYFIKLAPDFSVFDMFEKYYIDNNLTDEIIKDVFFYKYRNFSFINNLYTVTIPFFRGMFFILTTGDITLGGNDDEHTIFPYKEGYIIIAIKDEPIKIESASDIDLLIGVAF